MDKEKLQILISGILDEHPGMAKVKLAKLVLFSEIEYFRKHGDSFTGLYFVRLRKGPVIAFFDDVLNENEGVLWKKGTKKIRIYTEGRMGAQYSYTALGKPEVPEALQAIIKSIMSDYGSKTGTELSDLSHKRPAWLRSEPNEPIYIAELAVENERDYFALVDLIESLDEGEDESLPENIRQALQ